MKNLKYFAVLIFLFPAIAFSAIPSLCDDGNDTNKKLWGDIQSVKSLSNSEEEWIYSDRILIFKNHKLIQITDSQGIESKIKTCSGESLNTVKLSSIDKFRGQTQYQTLTCSLTAKIAFAEVELRAINNPYEKISQCLSDGRMIVKSLFPNATLKIKKPSANKLFKEFYAAWLTAFNAISPKPDDRVNEYRLRLDTLQQKTESIWNNFEIENN